MNDEIKIRVHVTKGSLVLAELHSVVDGGRHEFVFQQAIRTDSGRHFEGFAVECWLDREARHVTYQGAAEGVFGNTEREMLAGERLQLPFTR